MTDRPHTDERVEAAARALAIMACGEARWADGTLRNRELWTNSWRDEARAAIDAADDADPLRDRGRSVPIIEQALAEWWAVPGPLEPGRDLAEAVFDALNGGGDD